MRKITVTIKPDGTIVVNNSGNSNEEQILQELSDLSKILNGDAAGYKVEEHTHSHDGHNHTHDHNHNHGA